MPDWLTLHTITGAAFRALADFEPEQARIAERLQNIRSICDHLRQLHLLTGNLNRIAKALKIVAININIESCHAGEYQDSFPVLSQEIRALSSSVTSLGHALRDEIQTTSSKLEKMQEAMQANLSRFSHVAKEAYEMVERAEPQCQLLMERTVSALQRASVDAEGISCNTGQIVVNLQIHDNVSQRVEHVVEALDDACLNIDQSCSDTEDKGICTDPLRAIDASLELQQAQLEYATADIDGVFQESAQAFSAIGDMIRDITEGVLQIAWGQASAGPLIKGVRFANQMAEGDLTARIEVDQKDEVGQLAAALKQMIAKLANIVMEVKRAADNVASGSQEMSASSEEMSQGATEQAASAEEASPSMEQMAANIKQNADNALQAEKDEALKKMDCSYPEQSGSGFEINRTDIGGNGDHKDADFERY